LFYLTSKWLSNDASQELVTKGYIKNILEQFTDISDDEKNDIENTILSNIIK
jgi:Fe-S cluster assembly scaffold protein SufB